MTKNTSHNTIEHLFRQEYGKLISFLTAKLGSNHIDLIEDAVQDALYKAMQLWSYQETPKEPGKWLYRTAYNSIIDVLRRDSKSVEFNPDILPIEMTSVTEEYNMSNNIEDDQLKMIFACCHPSMKEGEQIMLSLKLLCGFSIKEIARALLKEPEAVKKALTRAKQKFKTEIGELVLPNDQDISTRLDSVLKVVYLIFNNGYTAFDGDLVLKKDVCEDAMRLTGMLYENNLTNSPKTKAVFALMCFNFSRFDARVDKTGNLLTLDEQNRKEWDNELIQLGLYFLNQSAEGEELSNYHLEAGIAREYAISESFASINWTAILNIYDLLLNQANNENIALNRMVVLEKIEGPKLALIELNKLDKSNFIKNHLYYSIKGDFEKKLNKSTYKSSLKKAIELTENQKEKEFLFLKI
jgi:RNA polymerase sigma-70 factor (ECF subfamily)